MHILVIRTSAMGDVALTTPVIRAFLDKYPGNNITVVTRSSFRPFFSSIERVGIFCPDFRNRHKGLIGIFRLFNDIRKQQHIDIVIDLHNVLRSRILSLLFRLSGKLVFTITKGRRDKRKVIKGIIRTSLKHTVERYCDAFRQAGFELTPVKGNCIRPLPDIVKKLAVSLPEANVIEIGVAPFAKHALKKWPQENMIRLLELIRASNNIKIWLFGGFEESVQLAMLQEKIPGSTVVAGSFTLDEELALMARLRFMIAMDSSNMHMASLVGTKVISIWGGTDPITGFSPWGQPEEYALRIPAGELTCRPCTVYGKGTCRRGDLACMNWLTPEKIYERILNLNII